MDNKKTLSMDDVYEACVKAAMRMGSDRKEAIEYLSHNAFFDYMFDNLEYTSYTTKHERQSNRSK